MDLFRRIDEWEMRRRFNCGRYWKRAQAGEFQIVVRRTRKPQASSGQENSTRSQEVRYYKGSQEIARVHQFVKLDGTLGASHFPDPKRLWEKGILYRLYTAAEPYTLRRAAHSRLQSFIAKLCKWLR